MKKRLKFLDIISNQALSSSTGWQRCVVFSLMKSSFISMLTVSSDVVSTCMHQHYTFTDTSNCGGGSYWHMPHDLVAVADD